jgi:hypothetical protein
MNGVSLEQLFNEAQKYGRVRVSQSSTGVGWSAYITFNTINHIELEAKSGFNHKSPGLALSAAIENAVLIVESMKQSAAVDTEQTQQMLGLKQKVLKLLGKAGAA